MVYAVSDLHGQYALWEQIKNFLEEDDILYCLGDCVDRGEGGVQILIEMIEDPRVIMIMGNHEEFLLDTFSEELYQECSYNISKRAWFSNGGDITYDSLKSYCEKNDIPIQYFLYEVARFHDTKIYQNKNEQFIFLSHSGFNPWESATDASESYRWNRKHIKTLPADFENSTFSDVIMVHGHTPVFNLSDEVKMLTYCNGHKIDIDMGSFVSGIGCLLNLDTLEPIYFHAEIDDEGKRYL